MICFVLALWRRRAREFTGTLYAALFAVAALLPLERAVAQSSSPAAASSTTARRDSLARAKRRARARARRTDAAAKAKRTAGSRVPQASTGSAGAAPAVSTRTAAGSQGAAGSGNAASPSATPASPRPTPAAATSATGAVAATGAGSSAGRSTAGSGSGSSGRVRAKRGDPATAKGKGATAITDGGPALGFYGGASAAGFGFGIGPTLGAAWRFAAPTTALRLRADLMGSHYSQTASALAGGAAITQSSSLTHLGATLSAELSLSNRRTLRPYLMAGGGVFRFQASGPSGSNGTIANGVFKSTTDFAGIGGVGLQLNPRLYLEARYLTVGDFHTIPVTAGVRF